MVKLSKQKILALFRKSESRASILLKNKSNASTTITDALGKAINNKGELESVWGKMLLLFSISKDYVNGIYTEVPKRSIIAIVGGLVYFLSPIDVIPDFIPALGFIDDIYILNLVYRQVVKDLEKYREWKDAQPKIISIDGASG